MPSHLAGIRRPAGPGLKRTLGFVEVTASGVGIIIGAGIYVLIGAAAEEAGSAVWLSFVLAAVLSALTGLSYAELASMYPLAGAEYEYTRRAFPHWVAFTVGWVMVGGLVIASSAVSLGFARYLDHFVEIDARLGAILLLGFVTVVALGGIRFSSWLTLGLSAVQVGGLLFVVVLGGSHVGDVSLTEGTGVAGLLGGAALVFFAFIGFDEVITLAEETHNPTKVVPLALFAALGISTALYVAVAIVSVSVLGAEALGASERPLTDVMGHVVGGASVDVVSAVAMVATTNTTLLATTAASRLAYGMASTGALPAVFARVGGRSRAPVFAIPACAVVSVGFLFAGDVGRIAGVTDTAVYFVFLAVNATVIVLRVREPGLPRPIRVPGSLGGVPVIPVLGLLSTLVMLTQLDATSLALGGGVIALGVVVALAFATRAQPGAPDGRAGA